MPNTKRPGNETATLAAAGSGSHDRLVADAMSNRLSTALRTHPYRIAGVAGLVLAGLAWVMFGYFGVHTLFVDDVVSEAAPVFDAAPDPVSTEPVVAEPARPTPSPAADTPSDEETSAMVPTTTTPMEPETEIVTGTETVTAPEILTVYRGAFMDESRYSTSGQVVVLGNGTEQRFLRFEDFATDNGPDLNVYLVNSSTGDVSDYVDLGDLKGNIGDQNYEIPAGVDLDVYDRVVVWCVRFGVGFGSASLMAG